MIYDNIISGYTYNNYPLPSSTLLVYYGEKKKGSQRVPTINYVANFDSEHILCGEFGGGSSWTTRIMTDSDDSDFVAQNETMYIVNRVNSLETINLPTNLTANDKNFQFIVKYVGIKSGYATVVGNNNIKASDRSDALYSNVRIDYNTPQAYFYWDGSKWLVSYQGVNIYNNITPYWNNKVLSTINESVNVGDAENTRYIATANGISINLQKASLVRDEYRVDVNTQNLTGRDEISITQLNDKFIYEGRQVSTIPVNRSVKNIEIIKPSGTNKYYAFTNDEEYWVDDVVSTNVTAKNNFRYICTSGLTITLPSNPNEYDRVAVYTQKLGKTSTTSSVCIKSPDKMIRVGVTDIDTSDPKGLEVSNVLIYFELVFFETRWHLIDLSVAGGAGGNGEKYYGDQTTIHLNTSNNTFSVKPSTVNEQYLATYGGTVQWRTITYPGITVDDTTIKKPGDVVQIKSIYTKIDATPVGILQKQENGENTIIHCLIPAPPSEGKHVLYAEDGTMSWIPVSECPSNQP